MYTLLVVLRVLGSIFLALYSALKTFRAAHGALRMVF